MILAFLTVKIDGIRLIYIFRQLGTSGSSISLGRPQREPDLLRIRMFCKQCLDELAALPVGYLRLRQSVVYPYNQLLSLSYWTGLLEQIIESRCVGYCIFGKGGDYHATNDAVKLIEPNNDDVDHFKSVETHGSGFPDFIGAMKNIPVRKESGRDVLVSDSERKRVHQCFR